MEQVMAIVDLKSTRQSLYMHVYKVDISMTDITWLGLHDAFVKLVHSG